MLRPALLRVAADFPRARAQPFAGHPLARFVRRDLPQAARAALPLGHDDLLVRASPGRGPWAAVPWLAFFDLLVTRSAQGRGLP